MGCFTSITVHAFTCAMHPPACAMFDVLATACAKHHFAVHASCGSDAELERSKQFHMEDDQGKEATAHGGAMLVCVDALAVKQ